MKTFSRMSDKEKELRKILGFLFVGYLGRDGTPEEYNDAIATLQKRYWITPPELWEKLRAEFGPLYDPCPHPRPEGYDGLKAEWGSANYVNPPFRKSSDGGITDWVKKMIEEQKKGKTSLLMFPSYGWIHRLINAGAEVRSLGVIRWIAVENGSRQKAGAGLPILMFVLRGRKQRKKKENTNGK
jgi:hypothetical protein